MKNKSSALKVFILNAIIMLIISKAIYWHPFEGRFRIIGLIILYGMMLLGMPLLTYVYKPIADIFDSLFKSVYDKFIYVKKNWKRTLAIIACYVVLAVVCMAGVKFYYMLRGTRYNYLTTYLFICVSYIVLTVYLLKKDIVAKPEKIFLSIIIIIGSTIILVEPTNVGLNWDDGIHYSGVSTIANFFDETGYQADEALYPMEYAVGHEHAYYSEQERAEFSTMLNESYANRELAEQRTRYEISDIAYIPYAAGVFVGRALSLSYTKIFKLAKLFNLLVYAFVIYAGMKKIKAGKILMATIALIPTSLYMACNFAYDPWVIAWSMYGFAYFISFLQDREKKITKSDEIKMLGAFVIGLLPKATYFIMMLPLFLMPSTAFKNKKERQQYLVLVLISGLILALSFGLPFLIQGPGTGDLRGGSDVNSPAQVAYILSHPIQFIETMGTFLINYLSFDYMGEYTQRIAYLGFGSLSTATTVVLYVTAFLDRTGEKSKNIWVCIVSYLGAFLAIFLAALALYISYTSVGSDSVGGCQARYILPVVFIFLYMVGFDGVNNTVNRKIFNLFPMMFMVFTLILNILLPIIRLF